MTAKIEMEIMDFAAKLLWHHGLDDWKVEFSRSKGRLGHCTYSKKTIFVSRPYLSVLPREKLEDTVRHEVAHALAGPGAGHGPEWVRMCRVTGAHPSATANVPRLPGRYALTCRVCDNTVHAHRAGSAIMAGRYRCRRCNVRVTVTDTKTGKVLVA